MPCNIVLSALAFATLALGDELELVTFDGRNGTSFQFHEFEDPVMGSESWGNWSIDKSQGFGILDGIVTIVDRPAVSIVGASPGFVKAGANGHFRDASDFANGALVLRVRSSTPAYSGFHVSFAAGAKSPSYACEGGGHIPLSRGCYKARFVIPAGDEFVKISIPFSEFSDLWKPATGNQTVTCSKDKSVCPTASGLKAIQRIELWAEGESAKVHLEIQSISVSQAIRRAMIV